MEAGIEFLAIEHFDNIMEELDIISKPVMEAYNEINSEYAQLMEKVKGKINS